MIKYIKSEDIDEVKWDTCLKASSNKNFFGYSWYLNAVCDHWDALILNDYEAVFPLPNTLKFGFRVLYQPFFSRHFNIYSQKDLTDETKQLFFDMIKKRFPRILLGYGKQDKFRPHGLTIQELPYQVLSLDTTHEALASQYSKNARRLIKRANKYAFDIDRVSPEQVVDLFKQTKGAEIKELKKADFGHLKGLMSACMENEIGVSLGAHDQHGQLCAVAFFVVEHETVFYLKGASNETGRKEGAMYLLFDHMISKYAEHGMVFDFGGSRIPSVANFYKKFGSVDQSYYFISKRFLF